MASARRLSAEETTDVERGEVSVDGPASRIKLPSWDRIGERTNSIAASLTSGNPTGGRTVRASDKAKRLTGFPEGLQRRSRDPGAWFRALPYTVRGHVVSIIGELIGTFCFLFFAFAATQVAVNSNHPPHDAAAQSPSMLLYIALAFGFSLAANAWTFFRVSGGLFNPAVNFALCLVGALTWIRGGLLFIAQILGALCAAAVVSALFPGDLAVDTTLGTGASTAQGFFIEAFATFELVLVIFMLAAEKHEGRFLAPIGIGLALFIAELAAVAYTGGSLNPARSFAPAVINHSFPRYHWIYWLGPLLGASVAALVYKLLKTLEYETANPDSVDPVADPESHRSSRARPPTPPVLVLGRGSHYSEEEDFHSARDWPLTSQARTLSGFGEGLILPRAQGGSRRTRSPD